MKRILSVILAVALVSAVFILPVAASDEASAQSGQDSAPQAEEEIGGISKTAWTVLFVLVSALICYAAYSVKTKNKSNRK